MGRLFPVSLRRFSEPLHVCVASASSRAPHRRQGLLFRSGQLFSTPARRCWLGASPRVIVRRHPRAPFTPASAWRRRTPYAAAPRRCFGPGRGAAPASRIARSGSRRLLSEASSAVVAALVAVAEAGVVEVVEGPVLPVPGPGDYASRPRRQRRQSKGRPRRQPRRRRGQRGPS